MHFGAKCSVGLGSKQSESIMIHVAFYYISLSQSHLCRNFLPFFHQMPFFDLINNLFNAVFVKDYSSFLTLFSLMVKDNGACMELLSSVQRRLIFFLRQFYENYGGLVMVQKRVGY